MIIARSLLLAKSCMLICTRPYSLLDMPSRFPLPHHSVPGLLYDDVTWAQDTFFFNFSCVDTAMNQINFTASRRPIHLMQHVNYSDS